MPPLRFVTGPIEGGEGDATDEPARMVLIATIAPVGKKHPTPFRGHPTDLAENPVGESGGRKNNPTPFYLLKKS